VLGELLADTVGAGVVAIDLRDRDDDGDASCLRVADGLDRLRHDAVVGCDDQDRDVGYLRAAGAHLGERLVAGRVEECDLAAVLEGDHARADVLGDAAGLSACDVGLADVVEQGRLAVVDVAKDCDDRRARDELGVLVLGLELLQQRVLGRDLRLEGDLDLELEADQVDGVLVEHRVRRNHQVVVLEQDLDDLGGLRAGELAEPLHRDRQFHHHLGGADDGDGDARAARAATTHREGFLATLSAVAVRDAAAAVATSARRTIGAGQ